MKEPQVRQRLPALEAIGMDTHARACAWLLYRGGPARSRWVTPIHSPGKLSHPHRRLDAYLCMGPTWLSFFYWQVVDNATEAGQEVDMSALK